MAIKKNNSVQCKLTDFGESTEAVARRCSVKNVLLKISQNKRKTPVSESFFNKVAG